MKRIKQSFIVSILLVSLLFVFNGNNTNALNSSTKQITTKTTRGVGDKIKDIFPDPNFAQGVANRIAGGDVNAILTQNMVDNTTGLTVQDKNVQSIEGIGVLKNLNFVDFSTNKITELPPEFMTLVKLKDIYLYTNMITALPDNFGVFPVLEDFRLSGYEETSPNYSPLLSLPESFGNLPKLKRFSITYAKLDTIPDSIGDLPMLELISITHSKLRVLPSSISNSSTLKVLNLYNNSLTTLPDSIGDLPAITDIYLHYNKLTSLPNTITKLSTLKVLVTDYNPLRSFPENIGDLTNLETLSARVNRLVKLPDSFTNLTNLLDLSLDYNQLTSLPTSFSNLNKLRWANFTNNLLPSNYHVTLNSYGHAYTLNVDPQTQLSVRTTAQPFTIKTINELNTLDPYSVLQINGGTNAYSSHVFILEDFVDENGDPVDYNTYFTDGKANTQATIFAKVRATGSGLFPNNSERALTTNRIQINLEIPVFYTLSFDLNGGESSAIADQTLAAGDVASAITNPTRTGYDFMGWNTAADNTGTEWLIATTTMPANNVTLYAQWQPKQFNITYDLNGGSITTTNPTTYTYGVGVTSLNNPTRVGYTFAGWMNTTTNDQNITSISTTQTGDITLKAIWTDGNLIVDPDPGGEVLLPKPSGENKLPNTGSDLNLLTIITLLLLSSTCIYRIRTNK